MTNSPEEEEDRMHWISRCIDFIVGIICLFSAFVIAASAARLPAEAWDSPESLLRFFAATILAAAAMSFFAPLAEKRP